MMRQKYYGDNDLVSYKCNVATLNRQLVALIFLITLVSLSGAGSAAVDITNSSTLRLIGTPFYNASVACTTNSPFNMNYSDGSPYIINYYAKPAFGYKNATGSTIWSGVTFDSCSFSDTLDTISLNYHSNENAFNMSVNMSFFDNYFIWNATIWATNQNNITIIDVAYPTTYAVGIINSSYAFSPEANTMYFSYNTSVDVYMHHAVTDVVMGATNYEYSPPEYTSIFLMNVTNLPMSMTYMSVPFGCNGYSIAFSKDYYGKIGGSCYGINDEMLVLQNNTNQQFSYPIMFTVGRTNEFDVLKNITDIMNAKGIINLSKPTYSWWRGSEFNTWSLFNGNIGANENDTIAMANTYINNSIPLDILTIDDKWMKYYGDSSANLTLFPNITNTIQQLHSKGLKVNLWWRVWTLESTSPKYNASWMIKDSSHNPTVYLDPTVPQVQEYLQNETTTMIQTYGADGLKLDYTFILPQVNSPKMYYNDNLQSGDAAYYLYLRTVYNKAKQIRPDAMITVASPNPLFFDYLDVIRANDNAWTKRWTTLNYLSKNISFFSDNGASTSTTNNPDSISNLAHAVAYNGIPSIYFKEGIFSADSNIGRTKIYESFTRFPDFKTLNLVNPDNITNAWNGISIQQGLYQSTSNILYFADGGGDFNYTVTGEKAFTMNTSRAILGKHDTWLLGIVIGQSSANTVNLTLYNTTQFNLSFSNPKWYNLVNKSIDASGLTLIKALPVNYSGVYAIADLGTFTLPPSGLATLKDTNNNTIDDSVPMNRITNSTGTYINSTQNYTSITLEWTAYGRKVERVRNSTGYLIKGRDYAFNSTTGTVTLYNQTITDSGFKYYNIQYAKMPSTAAATIGGAIAVTAYLLLRKRKKK